MVDYSQKNITKTADSLYILSRIDKPFQYPYEVDHYCIIYPKATDFLEQKNQIQEDFFANFKFPNGFIQNTNQRDFLARTTFIIKRDAQISDISVEIEFTNPENKKFNKAITNELTKFIENTNWKAAVSNGIMVDCKFDINFYN